MPVREGLATPKTVTEQIRAVYREHADQPALLTSAGWLTFQQVGDAAGAAAHLLAEEGAVAGDRVILYMRNSAIMRILEHALIGAGLVRVALSSRLHPRELAAIVLDSEARMVCCEPERAAEVRRALAAAESDCRVLEFADSGLADTDAVCTIATLTDAAPPDGSGPVPDETDLLMLMYSSGTTGEPKAAQVTHRGWLAQWRHALGQLPEIGPGDVVLAVAEMSHFGGSIGLDCALRGAATVPMPRFSPERTLQAAREHRVTVLPLVPAMLARLLELRTFCDSHLPTLRAIPYGGSPISVQDIVAAAGRFPGTLVQFYGLAEALAPLSCLTAADHDAGAFAVRALHSASPAARRLESAGRFVPGVDHLVVEGELCVRGETVMPGYWRRDELTSARLDTDGWFATGDLVRLDEDGYVYVLSRVDDVINTGGFKVYPREVERVIEDLPEIDEVAVLGVDDDRWGEGVHAVVVLTPRGLAMFRGESSRGALEAYLAETVTSQLARHKKPVGVTVVDHIPRSVNGKVDRTALRGLAVRAADDQQLSG